MKFRLPISSNQRRPLFANPLPGFDPAYYLDRNPDVRRAGLDPLQHFLNHGWTEGRDPSAGFSTAGYLAANPDVATRPRIQAIDAFPVRAIIRPGRRKRGDMSV